MGLDITYCKTLGDPIDGSIMNYMADCQDGNHILLHVNHHFPAQADGINGGWYHASGMGEFTAGSYGRYNEWRNKLSELTKCSEIGNSNTFRELIEFSDCVGTIGPKTSRKLANDFTGLLPTVMHMMANDVEFTIHYVRWLAAFSIAADTGVVSFG